MTVRLARGPRRSATSDRPAAVPADRLVVGFALEVPATTLAQCRAEGGGPDDRDARERDQ